MKQLKVTDRYTIRDTISAQKYFNDVSSKKMLTADEEAELTTKMMSGDEKARKRVIEANLRFVISVSKAYSNMGVPLEDLVSAGNYGLVEASYRFDPSRGFKFISFAVWYIRKEMNKLVDDTSRIVRLPLNRLKTIRAVSKITNNYLLNENREPSIEELIEDLANIEIKIDKETLISILNANLFGASLDGKINSDDDSLTLYDVLENHSEKTDAPLNEKSRKEVILHGMRQLSHHEKELIIFRHGLFGNAEKSFKELGELFELSGETLRHRYLRALQKLKFALRKAKLDKNNYYDEPTARKTLH